MEEKKENKESPEPAEKQVEIKPVFPQGQIGIFSNFAIVQRDKQEFYLSFFQIQLPVMIGDSEKIDKTFDDIQSVEAPCLAKIVMTKDRIQGLIRALKDQLQKSEATKDSPSEPEK